MIRFSYFFGLVSSMVSIYVTNMALAQPIFGPEFTFTNKDVLNDLSNRNRAGENWANLIRLRCKTQGCRQVELWDTHGSKFAFEDGFWFMLGFDSGVIEVTTKPLTLEGFESQALRLQEMIFNTAREVGLFPHSEEGGGHIHLDIDSTFGSDMNFIRNFVVDFHNHPELASGILGADHFNALPLAVMGPEIISAWGSLISDFDERFTRFAGELFSDVRDDFFDQYVNFFSELRRREGVNISDRIFALEYRSTTQTFEVRAFNPQNSADDFLSDLRLLKGRLDVIKRQSSNLIVDVPNVHRLRNPKWETPHLTIEDAARFRRYVEESGLRWENYRHLAKPHTNPYLSRPVTVGSISTAVLPRFDRTGNQRSMTQGLRMRNEENPGAQPPRNYLDHNYLDGSTGCQDLLQRLNPGDPR